MKSRQENDFNTCQSYSTDEVNYTSLIDESLNFQQATILREDLPGFIFESNRGTKHSFTAETSLGPEFAAGWTGKRGKRLRSKIEAMKQKVRRPVKSHDLSHVFYMM